MNSFERMVYGLMAVPRLPVIIYFSLSGIAVGLFSIFKPASCIEIQKRFYARINWRMEPISMEKELTHTRILGWFLTALSLAALCLVICKPDLL
ncbi:MAG: hypothetical protein ABIG31_01240 [Candidatus Omnitrophota bacterium]